jgi:chromate transporter
LTADSAAVVKLADRIGLWDLAVLFLRIGLGSFGGLLTTMALVEREFVDRRRLLTQQDLTEAVTYTRLLPGSGGPLVISYLGFRLRGWPGSAIATACLLLPGVVMMVALAIGFVTLSVLPEMKRAISGLLAAVVGIQAVTMYRFGRKNVNDVITAAIFSIVLVFALATDVNPGILVIAAGLVGALVLVKP